MKCIEFNKQYAIEEHTFEETENKAKNQHPFELVGAF
jgi:hypothetical protein